MPEKLKAKNPDRQQDLDEFLHSEEHLRQQHGAPARYNVVGPRGKGRYYVTAIIPGTIQCTSCQRDLKLGDRVMVDVAEASHYTCPDQDGV